VCSAPTESEETHYHRVFDNRQTIYDGPGTFEGMGQSMINPLNPELNPICYLLALLAYHFLHVSRIRVISLTLRLLMSHIYGAPILDVSRSHNDAAQSVGLLWTSDQLVAETST